MSLVASGALRVLKDDAALPTLSAALDPSLAAEALSGRLNVPLADMRLAAIRVLAYTPRRRCLVEYRLESASPGDRRRLVSILGTIRKNRSGSRGTRQLRALWNAGFDGRSADAISIPRPLGTLPMLRMSLQENVDAAAADMLLTARDTRLAGRIAAAVHKLHAAPLVPERRHTMEDELRILTRGLTATAQEYPEFRSRIAYIIDRAFRVGASLSVPRRWCPSVRAFSPDQVLVRDDRVFILNADLFCAAAPAHDIGSFLGHVAEQSLRVHGHPDALAAFEDRLEAEFVKRAGEDVRRPVRIYAALTIARHVYLSSRRQGRTHLLPALVTLAEARLARLAHVGSR
jgi:hypothetical protein